MLIFYVKYNCRFLLANQGEKDASKKTKNHSSTKTFKSPVCFGKYCGT
ncbi:hypothetical protein COXBURSA334_1594 [Coxiella burnetii Q321]|nr:hypothetical protein COXBURSA334_1594 [Coxiella burnetii Q321]